jgi:hypothetical protein
MSSTHLVPEPILEAPSIGEASVVYFVQIGKHIKIGVSTDLRRRIKSFENSCPEVYLLLSLPGDRALEQKLHDLLAESRVVREMFRPDRRVLEFITHYEYGGLDRGLRFLSLTTPAARSRKKAEDRERRLETIRRSKAEKDAYFAELVAARKKRLGW